LKATEFISVTPAENIPGRKLLEMFGFDLNLSEITVVDGVFLKIEQKGFIQLAIDSPYWRRVPIAKL